jgi:hypothetical protein
VHGGEQSGAEVSGPLGNVSTCVADGSRDYEGQGLKNGSKASTILKLFARVGLLQ